MERETFKRVLHKGLGQAIIYLSKHDDEPYKDIILHAVTHNTALWSDNLETGFRTVYKLQLINQTNNHDFYIAEILKSARNINDDTDKETAKYLASMLARLAMNGITDARALLYEITNKNLSEFESLGVSSLIHLDGIDGFLHITDKLGALKRSENKTDLGYFSLRLLKQDYGEEIFLGKLEETRQRNQNVDYILSLLEEEENTSKPIPSYYESLPYSEYKEKLSEIDPIHIWAWARKASDDDLLQAANDLFEAQDPQLIQRYLKIFNERDFPLKAWKLFRFTEIDEPDLNIPYLAFQAAARLQAVPVRVFWMINVQQRKHIGYASALLVNNFKEEDWNALRRISKWRLEDEQYHRLTQNVLKIFEKYPNAKAFDTLRYMYEFGVCSFCRMRLILAMKKLDMIPPLIEIEARYDSNLEIRELARNNFESDEEWF